MTIPSPEWLPEWLERINEPWVFGTDDAVPETRNTPNWGVPESPGEMLNLLFGGPDGVRNDT